MSLAKCVAILTLAVAALGVVAARQRPRTCDAGGCLAPVAPRAAVPLPPPPRLLPAAKPTYAEPPLAIPVPAVVPASHREPATEAGRRF